jgi:hypothetical protein
MRKVEKIFWRVLRLIWLCGNAADFGDVAVSPGIWV